MPAKAGIQEFFKLAPGLRREDDWNCNNLKS